MLAGRSQKLPDLFSPCSRKERAALYGDEFGRSLASKLKVPTTIDVDLQHGSTGNPAERDCRLSVACGFSLVGETTIGDVLGDQFGIYVAFSANGKRFVVGAKYNDDKATRDGLTCIYDWTGAAWNQLGRDIGGEATYDYFGRTR